MPLTQSISVTGGQGFGQGSADLGGFADATDPTGTIAANFSRMGSTFINTVTAFTSGTMEMVGLYLRAGQVVTAVNMVVGGTAPTASTHYFIALYTPARGLLGQSTDDTSATAGMVANTLRTTNLTAAQTCTSSGLHFIGIGQTVSAGNMPTWDGVNQNLSAITSIAPLVMGSSDAVVATAPSTAIALSYTGSQLPWIYLT